MSRVARKNIYSPRQKLRGLTQASRSRLLKNFPARSLGKPRCPCHRHDRHQEKKNIARDGCRYTVHSECRWIGDEWASLTTVLMEDWAERDPLDSSNLCSYQIRYGVPKQIVFSRYPGIGAPVILYGKDMLRL